MSVRAKLKLISVTESKWAAEMPAQHNLKFSTVYDPSIPEDQRFCKATPSGSAEFLVDNPAAVAQIELGKDYYLDFTPVPAA